MTELKKILISPLNWGLGHASRCVPIIDYLISQNHKVYIAAEGPSYAFLSSRYKSVEFVQLPSLNIKYGNNGMISFRFFISMLGLLPITIKEHHAIQKIISEKNIDIVISDNRLGLFSKKAKTFYITHQLNFKTQYLNGFAAFFMSQVHRFFIKKYDYCFVPDNEGSFSLSGKLSVSKLPNIKYIGVLSRLKEPEYDDNISDSDLLIVSGIEPQRTILENIFEKKYSQLPQSKLVIVRGLPSQTENKNSDYKNIKYYNTLNDCDLTKYILSAKHVFCRSGYSTLCDLYALKRRAVLIPTPKQPEQEYLAKYFCETFQFTIVNQKDLVYFDISNLDYDRIWQCRNVELIIKDI